MSAPLHLRRTPNGWTNGNLVIIFRHYNPIGTQRWMAVWTDFMSSKHEINEYTRERLVARLKPYGMGNIQFGRQQKESAR